MAMVRPLKWALAGLGGFIALLVLAAVVLPFVVDLQRFGPVIAGRVHDSTGRTVTLGRISFRLLPAPSLTVAPIALREGDRYPGRDAVRIGRLSVRLRVLPLLRGRVEFGAIILDQPVITLIRDHQGHWSYEDILATAHRADAAGQPTGAGTAAPQAPPVSAERIAIRDGRLLLYDDAVVPGHRSELQVGPIEAVVEGWGSGPAATIELSVGLGQSRLQASARLQEEGGARILEATVRPSRIAAADFVTLLPWLGVANPHGLKVGGAVSVEGKARVPLERLETVQFDGALTMDGLSYRDATMARPLEKVGGRLEVHQKSAEWKGFTATVGSSEVHGLLSVEDFLRPRIGFDLDCPRLDLNELVAGFAPPAAGAPGPAAHGGGDEGLLQVSARGAVRIGSLRFMNFDLKEVRGTVTFKDAVLRIGDLAAGLYGGRLNGGGALDLSKRPPSYRIEGALDGIDVNGLATAYDPAFKDLLKGRLGGRLTVDAAGADLSALLASAKGEARLEIVKGALTSFSVLKQLAGLLEAAGGKGIGRDETPFERLGGTFLIGDNRARTSDLALDSADLALAGTGEIGLDSALDLAVAATFSEDATRGMVEKTPAAKALTDQKGRLVVHLLARGNLAAPRIALDSRAQTRQLTEQKKAEVKDKVRGRLIDLLTGKPKNGDSAAPPP